MGVTVCSQAFALFFFSLYISYTGVKIVIFYLVDNSYSPNDYSLYPKIVASDPTIDRATRELEVEALPGKSCILYQKQKRLKPATRISAFRLLVL